MLWGSEVDFVVCVTEVTPDRVGRSVGPDGWVRGRSGLEGVGRSVECDSKFSPRCARQWVGRSVGPWHAKTIHSQSLYVALNTFPLKDWTLLGNWGVFN